MVSEFRIITETLKPYISKNKCFYFLGTAHCANMYPSSNTDSPELTEARLKIKAIIGEWLASSPYS